jgi:trans-2,3-dihydro-3-hydroxyanthranilate isomerase
MKSYPYTVVDVFTTEALEGNALAVFPDASELDASEIDKGIMQKIARELNLAETAFVLPATRNDCVARLRVFTPARELAFAGHPTIGAAFVLLQKETVPQSSSAFALELQAGPIPLRIEGGPRPMIWLHTPPIREGRCYDSALCAEALGLEPGELLPIQPQLLSAGNPTVIVAAKDKAAVDRAWLDSTGLKRLKGEESESFLRVPFHADGSWCLFPDVRAGTRDRRRPGDRQFHRTPGRVHDPAQAGLGPGGHALHQRAGNENGPSQLAACPSSGRG